MKEDILPLGSIVQLKNKKKLMIIGYYQAVDEKGKEYDYICCLPTIGITKEKKELKINTDIFYINNEDIETILFIGCSDEDYKKYKLVLSFSKEEYKLIKNNSNYDENTLREHFISFYETNFESKEDKEVEINE